MGFRNAGFDIKASVDLSKDACKTHTLWCPDCETVFVPKDHEIHSGVTIDNVEVILAQCPYESMIWDGKYYHSSFEFFLISECIDGHRPKAFVVAFRKPKKALLQARSSCGVLCWDDNYNVYRMNLNAADYQVPQDREMLFIIGIRKDFDCPDEFVVPKYDGLRLTMGDVLSTVSMPEPGDVCQEKFSSVYLSRNRHRGFSDVSFSIPAVPGRVPLYPGSPAMIQQGRGKWDIGANGTTRRLSWQECAAIQTFPAGMEFCGSLTSKYQQIGSSVPVRLAEVIGRRLVGIVK